MNTTDPLANPASQMYAARVQDEIDAHPTLYARNPEARQFYFKGVRDVLDTIANVMDVDPNAVATILDALHTEVIGTQNTALAN